jgi:hypothetical protein
MGQRKGWASVRLWAIELMMTSWLTSGRPRQFLAMKLHRRCSIWFHFEVPGGTSLSPSRYCVTTPN